MTPWQAIAVAMAGQVISFLTMVTYYRWRKQQEMPSELHKEIEEVRRDMVKIREDVARIKGRINGHGWRQEA